MPAGGGMETDANDRAISFAHALATLKEQGSALLVVGSVPDEVYAAASTEMLGDPSADAPRRRLVVTTDSSRRNAIEKVDRTGPASPEFARIVTCPNAARRASTATGTASPEPTVHAVGGTLSELGEVLSELVQEFDLYANSLSSAELRVAIDCLPSLLTMHGRDAAFRFLHTFLWQVRQVNGLVHVHLPRDPESELVRLLSPLFDATVSLRLDDGELRQRWEFRDYDVVSDWIPFD